MPMPVSKSTTKRYQKLKAWHGEAPCSFYKILLFCDDMFVTKTTHDSSRLPSPQVGTFVCGLGWRSGSSRSTFGATIELRRGGDFSRFFVSKTYTPNFRYILDLEVNETFCCFVFLQHFREKRDSSLLHPVSSQNNDFWMLLVFLVGRSWLQALFL